MAKKVNSLVSADLSSDDESKFGSKKEYFQKEKNWPNYKVHEKRIPQYGKYYEGSHRKYGEQLKHNEFVINNASLGNPDDLSRYYSVYELPHQRYYDPTRFYDYRNYPLTYEYPYRRYYDNNYSNFTLNSKRREEIEGDTNDLHPYILEHQCLKTFGADLDLDKPRPLKKNQGISTEKRLNQIVGGPSKENLRKSFDKREKSVYVSLNNHFDENSDGYKEIRDIVKRQYGTDNKDMADVIYNIIYGQNTHIIIQKQKVNNKTVIEEKIIDPKRIKSRSEEKRLKSRPKSEERSKSRLRSEEKIKSRTKSEERSRSRLRSEEKTKSDEKNQKSIEKLDTRRSRSPKKKKTNQGMGVTQELLLKDYELILGKNKNKKKKNFIDSFESSRFNNELNKKKSSGKIEEIQQNEVLLDLDSEKLRQLLKSDGMKKEIVIDVKGIKEKESDISKISTGVSAKNFDEVFAINNAEIAPRRDKSELYEEAILNLISKQFPQYSLESKDQINPGGNEAEKSNDLNKWENSAQDGRSLSFFNLDEKAETRNEDPVSILSNDILNCLQESCKRTKSVPKENQFSKRKNKKKNKSENETIIENILNLICYEKELSNFEIKNTSTKTKILKEAGTMDEKEITSNYVLVDTPDVLKSLEETLLNELLHRLCWMNDNQSVPKDVHETFQNKEQQ